MENNVEAMTIMLLKNGKHPVLKPKNYVTDALPVPNMTIFNQNTGHYTGVRFSANCSMLLDLFSMDKNFDSRYFITMDEVKRMKLDNVVKREDQIDVSVKGITGDLRSIRLVNAESFLQSPQNPRGYLSGDDFKQYFPDFDKQIPNFISFSKKLIKSLQNNIENTAAYTNIKKQIAADTKNSPLPKLTAEMIHCEFCRLTRREYTPRFSREDHLNDMAILRKQNPELLKDAIRQSGYVLGQAINRLFNSDALSRENVQSRQGDRSRGQVRRYSREIQ